MRGPVLVILMSVLLAPSSAAQGAQALFPPALEVDAAAPVGPIEPDVGQATLSFDHRLNCDWDRAGLVAAEEATIVHEIVAHAGGVVMSGDLTRSIATEACATPTTQGIPFTAVFGVQVTPDAPGEVPIEVTLRSWAQTDHARSEPVEARSQVQAAYLGMLYVQVPQAVKQVTDGRAVFDLELGNLGNSATRVRIEADAPTGVTVDVPDDVVLQSRAQGGTESQVATSFTVRMGGNAGREAIVPVTFTPMSSKDGSMGQAVVVNVMVVDDALMKAVESPGPVPVLVVPVLMGAALLARRRT